MNLLPHVQLSLATFQSENGAFDLSTITKFVDQTFEDLVLNQSNGNPMVALEDWEKKLEPVKLKKPGSSTSLASETETQVSPIEAEIPVDPSIKKTVAARLLFANVINKITGATKEMNAKTLSRVRSLAKLLQAILSYFPIVGDENEKRQLISDAKSLQQSSEPNVSEVARSGLSFTVLLSDPRSLLTIGDIVNTSSCQNYKFGGQIQSLLGYVEDANVKAIVSFALNASHFSDQKEYDALYRAVS